MTNVSLPADLEDWAREEVAAGRAESVDGFVAKVLRDQRALIGGHKALVEEAYRQMKNGEGIDEAEMDAIIEGWLAEDQKR